MEKLSKLQFHTDKGHMIDMLDVDHKKRSMLRVTFNCPNQQELSKISTNHR